MDIFSASVVGYKNKLKKNQSQDYVDYKLINNGVICAVCDGHSTDYFSYSDVGAKLACTASIHVLEETCLDLEKAVEKLKTGEVQKLIYDKWMNMVDEHYKKTHPVVYKTEYIKYSTTMIAALITNEYRVYLKLGDGGIIEKNNERFNKILDLPQKPIVDSLGREDAFVNIEYDIKATKDKSDSPNWVILFTDGYENSYASNNNLFNSLKVTISKYNSNIFSKVRLKNNYKNYLNKLSKDTSHDDISIIFIGIY